jgi:hypothetical protein
MAADDAASEAYKEAQRRIGAWRPGDTLVLTIRGLTNLPPEIGDLDVEVET